MSTHSQIATNQFYGTIVEILAQASEQGLDLADKRLRVLLMIFHHFRTNASFRDPNCLSSRQLEVLRLQTKAYMSLVNGFSPPSSSLLHLSQYQISPGGRALAAALASRPPFHIAQFVPAPPPLDGPEGAVDWPGHLFPQLRAARTRKRVLATLAADVDSENAVARVSKLIEAQRKVRATLLEQRKRPKLALVSLGSSGVGGLASRVRLSDPQQIHTKFLHELLMHRQQFLDFHRRKRETLRRICHAVARRVASAAAGTMVVEESIEARLQRERIAALKAQDEEAYLRLLAESKNERLNDLIRQTEDYMRTLGALVVEHKGDALSSSVNPTNATSESEQHRLLQAKAEYFALTHSVQEVVGEQPSTLSRSLKLRDYQLKGLEYLVSLHNNRLSGILADEQGLGKSATTIAFLAWLWEHRGVGGPFMIIAPLSVLKSTWVGEIKRWCSVLADGMVIYEGHKEQRKEMKNRYIDPMVRLQMGSRGGTGADSLSHQPFTVLLTTDAFILKDQSILKKVQWEYIVVDEAHRLKNPKSKLVQLLNKNFNSNFRLALTGTPLQNDLQEVWALLNFLMPKIFSSNDSFREWFSGPLAAATRSGKRGPGGISGSETAIDLSEEEKLLVIDRLHKVLKPFILRRTKSEVMAELPRKTEQIVWCKLTGVQKRLYDELIALQQSGGSNLSSLVWEAGKTLNLQMNLRKVCNHPYLFATSLERVTADESLIRSCGKLVVLDGILARLKASPDKHRVLIFSQMTKVLDLLELFMNYRDHSYVRLDGNTSSDQREEVVKRFSAPNADIFCFLLSTRSGGLGLNLISADTCILFDQDFNPAGDEQAKARTHRIGQTRETLVIRLVTRNSIEERMLEIAETKQQQDELVIQQGKYHHDGEHETIEEKRDKLLEILGRRDGFGRREDESVYVGAMEGDMMYGGERLEMDRGENERWLFEKVDMRMNQLGYCRGIDLPVIPPCLLKKENAAEAKVWKEAYQRMDREFSLKLLVRDDPRGSTGSSDFQEELKLRRHQLNETVHRTMHECLQKFGWTEKQAPVIYDVRQSAKDGAYMSIHEVERSLQRVLDYAANTEYFWCFRLIGALNCRIRRLLWPLSDSGLQVDADLSGGAEEDDEEEEMDEEEDEGQHAIVAHIDEAIGFSKFLDQ